MNSTVYLSHLRKAVRDVIPAPDAGSPTQGGGEENFAARLGNQPQDESVEEPALRHQRGQQQKPGILVAIAPQRQGQQRSR